MIAGKTIYYILLNLLKTYDTIIYNEQLLHYL